MNKGTLRQVSVTPLTTAQRRRLEALTAAFGLLTDRGVIPPVKEALRAAEWIVGGTDE